MTHEEEIKELKMRTVELEALVKSVAESTAHPAGDIGSVYVYMPKVLWGALQFELKRGDISGR